MCVVSCLGWREASWLCAGFCAQAPACGCVRAHCLRVRSCPDPLALLQLRHSVRKHQDPIPHPCRRSQATARKPQLPVTPTGRFPLPGWGLPSGFPPSTFSSCPRGCCGRWSLAVATLSLTQAGAPSLTLMWPARPHSQTATRGCLRGSLVAMCPCPR